MSRSSKLDCTNSLSASELKRAFGSCKVDCPKLHKELHGALETIDFHGARDGWIPVESVAVEVLWRVAMDLSAVDKGPRNAISSMLGDQARNCHYELGLGSMYDVADNALFACDDSCDDWPMTGR